MSRYIDTDKAFEVLTDYYHHRTPIQSESLKEALSKVPTADVVEVVRCKDCKKQKDCKFPAKWNYCPDGERKDDAEIR